MEGQHYTVLQQGRVEDVEVSYGSSAWRDSASLTSTARRTDWKPDHEVERGCEGFSSFSAGVGL